MMWLGPKSCRAEAKSIGPKRKSFRMIPAKSCGKIALQFRMSGKGVGPHIVAASGSVKW